MLLFFGNKEKRRLQQQINELKLDNDLLRERLMNLLKEKENVKDYFGGSLESRNRMSLQSIADHVKAVIATVNNQAIKETQNQNAGMQYVVDEFEVELKGGVGVNDGIEFLQLHSTELNPESVSVIKFKVKPLTQTTISE